MQTPQQRIEEADRIAKRLADHHQAMWFPGTCPRSARKDAKAGELFCEGRGHPDDCDGAFEQGDYGPMPDKPTVKQLAETVGTDRTDTGEAIGYLLELIRGQQRQLEALSAKHASHRHMVGPGHWSDKAE